MRDRAPDQEVTDALTRARRTQAAPRPSRPGGPVGVLALQRRAGNAAVSALLSAKTKSPGEEAVGKIDDALREVRGDDPEIDTVETGLKAAKSAGVPVDIDGADKKPPASALAVALTGFGPGQVKPKPPPKPTKPVPKESPLAKAAKKPAGKTKPAGKPAAKGSSKPAPVPGGGGPAAAPGGGGPAPLAAGKELQPPEPPTKVAPGADPAFTAVTSKAGGLAKAKKAHAPAAAKAQEAQGAAMAPADDLESQAKAAKADTMDAQQPGAFDKKAFVAAVKAAVEAKSPKTLEEADEYKESGKAGEVKDDVQGLVGEGKQEQAKDITEATEAAPDPSKAVAKPVTPMAPEPPGSAGSVAAAGAAPKPAPAEQLNLEAGKHQADQELADADVDEKQLAESNEPDFTQALADKKEAAKHADSAPGEYRTAEQETIAQSKSEASAATAAAVTGIHGDRAAALAGLVGDKQKTKSKDEQKRAEVSAKIQGIFDAAESDVNKILDGIDPKVEEAFAQGEAKARAAFESFVDGKMSAYKRDRYGGWLGGLKWAKDKLFGMPSDVDKFYEAGRELYLKQMDQVISRVADIVGGDLTAAKQRIAKGRTEIASYVKSLPAELQQVGSEAATEIGDRFDQLSSDVDAKQDALVDTLATKYTEARQGLDARIEELQAANKGLVDKAIGAIKAVVNTIRELASMLKNVLARAAGVVGDIIKAPVKFLGNLIAGVKGGILRFKDNILDHLKKGLMGWLFGALAEGGVELPETFDLKGIVKLLASIFGLTWRNIRNRLVRQIGEPAMAAVEKGVDIFQRIASGGIAGVFELVVEKLGNVKDMIMEKVQDFVVTRVITAGITWLISLLNPAAAFIKACKLIYDIVMFFVHNGSRIMNFVNTVLDSVADIVRGNVGGVIGKIENALGKMVPILISFLASVIGLGGIGRKVRDIVQTLQKPVTRAIDGIIKTGLKLAGPVIRGLKNLGAKAKAKIAAGKAWVKGKAAGVRDRIRGGDSSPEGKQQRLDRGVAAAQAAVDRYAGRPVAATVLRALLPAIRVRHGLTVLKVEPDGDVWAVVGEVNPRKKVATAAKTEKEASVKGKMRVGLKSSGLDPETAPQGVAVFTQAERDFLHGKWMALAAQEPAEAAKYRKYAQDAKVGRKPHPLASEREIAWMYAEIGGTAQVSYRSGRAGGGKGSTRPDVQIGSWSLETKRYIIKRERGKEELIAELKRQFSARLRGLPAHMQMQAIVVDVRGQYLKPAEIQALQQEVYQRVVVACYEEAKAADHWWVAPGATGPGPDSVTVLAGDVG